MKSVCVLDAILMAWPVARGDFKCRSWMMKKSDLSLQTSTNLFPLAMNHLGSYSRKSSTHNFQSPYPCQSYIQSPYPCHITYQYLSYHQQIFPRATQQRVSLPHSAPAVRGVLKLVMVIKAGPLKWILANSSLS